MTYELRREYLEPLLPGAVFLVAAAVTRSNPRGIWPSIL
jgi:hypothetical protein